MSHLSLLVDRPTGDAIEMMILESEQRRRRRHFTARRDKLRARQLSVAVLPQIVVSSDDRIV
jgi:hypothetical protein